VKKGNGLLTLIVVVASIAAVTALVVTNIEKICDFFDTLKRKAGEACPFCCDDDEDELAPTESDFEDIEV